MAEFNAGNLYEMNKQLVKQHEKPIKGNNLFEKIQEVVVPYFLEKGKDSRYFMLLCHEKRDYTVFRFNHREFLEKPAFSAAMQLKECLVNRGTVYGIDRTEDSIAVEIWLEDEMDSEMNCYYLFPYEEAVIEVD